jgi:hypothetical protein
VLVYFLGGQVARPTQAIRRALHHRQQRLQRLAPRYRIHPKTETKGPKRPTVRDARTGADPVSTVPTTGQPAIVGAFRRHTLLALDDSLYTLPATIPRLSRSSLHRCFQRHGIDWVVSCSLSTSGKRCYRHVTTIRREYYLDWKRRPKAKQLLF